MKNIFRFLMAAVIFFGAVSCAKEDISSSLAGGEVEVTFTANLPELGTRAYGNAEHINILHYNVYQHGQEDQLKISGVCTENNGGKFIINIPMIKGMKYDIVFWAEKEGNGFYSLVGKELTIKYKDAVANDENRDAFLATLTDFDPSSAAHPYRVELKRPFAQLNVATSDYETIKRNGIYLTKVDGVNENTDNITSDLKITTQVDTKFNLFTNKVADGSEKQTVTFAPSKMPCASTPEETLNNYPGYTYLSMNYIFVLSEKESVDVEYNFTGNRPTATDNFKFPFTKVVIPSVPLKRNYRTNILGKLLTQTADFEVVLEKDFDEPDTELTKYLVDGVHYEDFRAAVAAALASESKTINFINDCTLEADETITVPEGNTLILNLNGNTLSCTTEDADKNDDGMITSADNEVVFDVRGTLTIKDGTVTLQHIGADYQNFGWNACGEICYVGFNGVLNVENAHLEHLGGVSMAYTIDLVNAASATRAFTDSKSGVLLNVNNSTLNSAYVAVRVFNNGTGMNNVNIVNSNLFGASRAFWVHVFTNTDNGGKGEKVETLNLNIFNTGNPDTDNTFNSNNPDERLIEFGFADNEFFQVDTNGIRKNDTTLFWDGSKLVASWSEFTTALGNGTTKIMLAADITYDANYQLQKSVILNLGGYSMTLPMINIHTKTTIKNGTINGKVYARKNSEIVFNNVKFSGAVADNLSTEGHLAIQGGCKSLYAKDCLFSPTSVSGSQTKPLSFEGGSTIMKFENCEFKSSPYKKQVYFNSLSATGSLDFTNCNFNNMTPNIMFAAACPLTNLTMSGTTKLSSVTLETNRAKDAVTAEDLAYLRESLIANNSMSSVRLFYAGGSSEYIR